MKVLQVVRRFGPVGGMETYVWELSRELLKKGVEVEIICEQDFSSVPTGIPTHLMGPAIETRNWKALRAFKSKIEPLLNIKIDQGFIVHSHERTCLHHVTTIHGPPMKPLSNHPWYSRGSTRLKWWCNAEIEELCGPNVMAVVPVSNLMFQQLSAHYPCCVDKLREPCYPGTRSTNNHVLFDRPSRRLRFIFVGKEWKRKGLELAIAIVSEFEDATLDVFGVEQNNVPKHLRKKFVYFNGWVSCIPFEQFDVLLHPAKQEPFGMVITEALIRGCRVIASENVGATELASHGLLIVKIADPLEIWIKKVRQVIKISGPATVSFPTWAEVADRYIRKVYKTLL